MITAALRAGAAWINWVEEPRAWRELSRMHGVLLSSLPVGAGPSTPAEMIDPLPWGELPSAMGDLIVLTDNSEPTEDAFEAGMNYLAALYGDDGYFELGGTCSLRGFDRRLSRQSGLPFGTSAPMGRPATWRRGPC
ncbi:pPIWI_RE_Y domain-containing protein [Streptomyces sp. NPDC002324]